MDKLQENELIELLNHVHNVASSALINIYMGAELNDNQEEFLTQLFMCSEEGHLQSLEDIPHTSNNYLTTIIMGRTKGSKNKNNLILSKMGKLDLNAPVLKLDGKAWAASPEEGDLTIRKAVKFAILNADLDKKSPVQKYEAYKLAIKVEGESPDFSVEELKVIKDSVGAVYAAPEIVGFIWDAIESK